MRASALNLPGSAAVPEVSAAVASPEIPITREAVGQHIADNMNAANTGGHSLTSGVHYAANYYKLCVESGRRDLWQDHYNYGHNSSGHFIEPDASRILTWDLKKGHSASAAIRAWLRGATVADCTTSVIAMQFDAMRAAMGDEKFDHAHGSTDAAVDDAIDAKQRLKITSEAYDTPLGEMLRYTPIVAKATFEGRGSITEADKEKHLKVGDWYYFSNHPKYLLKHPAGYWRGENSIYMGKNAAGQRLWSGLGASNVTEDEMYESLRSAYNAPRDGGDEAYLLSHHVDDDVKQPRIKDAAGHYNDRRYDPSSGVFDDEIKDVATMLKAEPYELRKELRRPGFSPTSGSILNLDKIKQRS